MVWYPAHRSSILLTEAHVTFSFETVTFIIMDRLISLSSLTFNTFYIHVHYMAVTAEQFSKWEGHERPSGFSNEQTNSFNPAPIEGPAESRGEGLQTARAVWAGNQLPVIIKLWCYDWFPEPSKREYSCNVSDSLNIDMNGSRKGECYPLREKNLIRCWPIMN